MSSQSMSPIIEKEIADDVLHRHEEVSAELPVEEEPEPAYENPIK